MRFFTRGEERTYTAGTVIFEEGGLSDNEVFYVIDGTVISTIVNNNETILSQTLSTGNIFGIASCFIKKGKQICTIRAVSDTKVYVWNKETFIAMVGIYQELARLVIIDLSKSLRDLNRILAERKKPE